MTNKSFDELNHYEKRLVNLVVRAKDLDNHDEDMFNGSVTEVAKIFLKYENYLRAENGSSFVVISILR